MSVESEHIYERDFQMHIYFGSQTGTAEAFAWSLKEDAERRYISVEVLSLQQFTAEVFVTHAIVILCVATTGDGEPTDDALRFHSWVSDPSHKQHLLRAMRFAVFGLGDSSYPKFNRMGEMTDSNLGKLGAHRICPRGVGDDSGDITNDFGIWTKALWLTVEKTLGPFGYGNHPHSPGATLVEEARLVLLKREALEEVPRGAHVKTIDALGIFFMESQTAEVTSRTELRQEADPGNGASTVDLELRFSSESAVCSYSAGGTLDIWPENHPDDIDTMMPLLGLVKSDLDGFITFAPSVVSAQLRVPFPTPCSLRRALQMYCDLRRAPTKRMLSAMLPHLDSKSRERVCRLVKDETCMALIRDESLSWSQFEFWKALGVSCLDLCTFLQYCPRQRARSFTIASSPHVAPRSIHLCISLSSGIRTSLNHAIEELRKKGIVSPGSTTPCRNGRWFGVCSEWLCRRVAIGHSVLVRVRPSLLKLPSADVPVVMIGAGAGVAPFRGFWSEIFADKSRSAPICLIFGCRHPDKDWIYKEEMMQAKENKTSSTTMIVHTAFSRCDRKGRYRKSANLGEYVQDQLRAHADKVRHWISCGGVCLICGSSPMGHAVLKVLQDIFGTTEVQQLRDDRRIMIEFWGNPNTRSSGICNGIAPVSVITKADCLFDVRTGYAKGSIVGLYTEGAHNNSIFKYQGEGFQREGKWSVSFNAHGQSGVGLKKLLTKTRRLEEAAVLDRAVLVQSTLSYSELLAHFPQHAYTLEIKNATSWNGFAENILVCDIAIDDVCVGDIWKVGNLELQVCTPRRPCHKIDKAHGSKFGQGGIKDYCLRSGLAGWFCRVLHEGTAYHGDSMRCVQRTYPDWTIRRVAATVYGNAPNETTISPSHLPKKVLFEMQKLGEVAALGDFEWRAPLLQFLGAQRVATSQKQVVKSTDVPSLAQHVALKQNDWVTSIDAPVLTPHAPKQKVVVASTDTKPVARHRRWKNSSTRKAE